VCVLGFGVGVRSGGRCPRGRGRIPNIRELGRRTSQPCGTSRRLLQSIRPPRLRRQFNRRVRPSVRSSHTHTHTSRPAGPERIGVVASSREIFHYRSLSAWRRRRRHDDNKRPGNDDDDDDESFSVVVASPAAASERANRGKCTIRNVQSRLASPRDKSYTKQRGKKHGCNAVSAAHHRRRPAYAASRTRTVLLEITEDRTINRPNRGKCN